MRGIVIEVLESSYFGERERENNREGRLRGRPTNRLPDKERK